MRHYIRPDGMPPVNGYSHAVAWTGPMVVVSGQLPIDSDGNVVGKDDVAAQTRQVFENLGTALAAAGSSLDQVVKVTVFLTDLADLGEFRRIRDQYINLDNPPASSLVQVSALLNADFRVEVEALAAT